MRNSIFFVFNCWFKLLFKMYLLHFFKEIFYNIFHRNDSFSKYTSLNNLFYHLIVFFQRLGVRANAIASKDPTEVTFDLGFIPLTSSGFSFPTSARPSVWRHRVRKSPTTTVRSRPSGSSLIQTLSITIWRKTNVSALRKGKHDYVAYMFILLTCKCCLRTHVVESIF